MRLVHGAFVAAAALALACAARGGAASASTGQTGLEQVPERPYLYVANQAGATISIIDVEGLVEVKRIDLQDLGFGPNAKPHDTAVEPDGAYWYVSLIGENRVLKFDRDNRLVGQVEMEVPGLVVAHPTEDLLLVGRSMTAVNPPPSVALIRRSDMTLLDELDVLFPRPHALAALEEGRWAYSASLAENRIGAIDLEAGDVNLIEVAAAPAPNDSTGGHAAMGHAPHTLVEFALAPDGQTMVAGGEISGDLIVFDLTVPGEPQVVRTVPVGGAPWHSAFSPDGRWLYVPLHRANAVAVVDAATWEVVDRIEGRGLAEPHQAAFSPDGRRVFVSNNNVRGDYTAEGEDPKAGTVVVIDAATREIVKVLEVGPQAAGIETVPAR